MTYDHPELLQRLSAEYVLGTLRGPARQRFERLLTVDEDARSYRLFWETRLGEFGEIVAPIAPPAAVRAGLLHQIEDGIPARPVDCRQTPLMAKATRANRGLRRRRKRALATFGAGAASTLLLVAAFWLGHNFSGSAQPQHLVDVAGTAPHSTRVMLGPTGASGIDSTPDLYLTRLQLPASQMQWLLSLSPDQRELSIVAADDLLSSLGRHSLQLWGISPDGTSRPLALMPVERDGSLVVTLPRELLNDPETVFAVSLEPAGGSPSGKPSGPVLSSSARSQRI
jgi:anti-sigma-K factor RskA